MSQTPSQASSHVAATPHTSRKFEYAVLIGRFQPVHFGHQRLIEHCLRIAERVIVVVGSDRLPRSFKNPFTREERERMIRGILRNPEQGRLSIVGVADSPYNDQIWIASIADAVNDLIVKDDRDPAGVKTALVGHQKDASSYYLKMFPRWEFAGVDNVESLNATDIRDLFFDPERAGQLAPAALPDSTAAFLEQFRKTSHYGQLVEERGFLKDYADKYRYAGSAFPPIFTTVDAVVVEVGYILLVQRRDHPGKGLWALPGGFVGQKEWLEDAAVRELREETRLKVPGPVLHGSIKGRQVFDAPDRSQRGRTITHAFYFELPHNQFAGLPPVKGDDDAAHAQWVPVGDFLAMQDRMFEDHFFIATHFLGALATR